MIKDEKYILKLEKFMGGRKVEERILKEFTSSEVLGILKDCESSKEVSDFIPVYMDEQNRSIEDSLYYGATYTTEI